MPTGLRRYLGQLVVVGFAGVALPVELRAIAREFDLGGVILFARNVDAPLQVAEMAYDVKQLSAIPPWVGVDQEGGRVQRYTPDGESDVAVPVPDHFVTSVCFGGADMRDLYVVTGGGTSDGGCIYRTRAPVAGVPTALAQVRPSQ